VRRSSGVKIVLSLQKQRIAFLFPSVPPKCDIRARPLSRRS